MKTEFSIDELYLLWSDDTLKFNELLPSGNLVIKIEEPLIGKYDKTFDRFLSYLFEGYVGDPLPISKVGNPGQDENFGMNLSDPGTSLYYLEQYTMFSQLIHKFYMSELFPIEAITNIQDLVHWDVLLDSKKVPEDVLIECLPTIGRSPDYRLALTRAEANNIELFKREPRLFAISSLVRNSDLNDDSYEKLLELFISSVDFSPSEILSFWTNSIAAGRPILDALMEFDIKQLRNQFSLDLHRFVSEVSKKYFDNFEFIRKRPDLFCFDTLLRFSNYGEDFLLELEDLLVNGLGKEGPSHTHFGRIEFLLSVMRYQDFSVEYFEDNILDLDTELKSSIKQAVYLNENLNDKVREHLTSMVEVLEAF